MRHERSQGRMNEKYMYKSVFEDINYFVEYILGDLEADEHL